LIKFTRESQSPLQIYRKRVSASAKIGLSQRDFRDPKEKGGRRGPEGRRCIDGSILIGGRNGELLKKAIGEKDLGAPAVCCAGA